jgi:hypothetical protein
LHTKRTGHTEFVDKTADAAKPISLEVPKETASGSEDAADATSQTEGTFSILRFVYIGAVFGQSTEI